ncbi:MAG: glycosyltransferase [Thermodesulfobacteriota bacterium]|nr:glycosyltransferase [Thermodesulfobacteriota bacterium]
MEQVRHRNRGIRKFWAMAVVATLEYVSRRLAERNLTFTVGREMYDAYSKGGRRVYQMAVSLVSEQDIDDTFRTVTVGLHAPVRLLSVGRLDPEKGLPLLIAAVEELVRVRRRDVVLWIVGKGLKGMEEWRLRQDVERRHLTNRVRFLGYVPHGEELFRIYRESDVFVLPSLTGEGIPQTLFEAMACGIPVIASRVAGIPSAVVNGKSGLLIRPGSSGQLCDAVERLIGDAELRKSLIRRGFDTARKHTLDAERDRMIARIEAWLEERKKKETVAKRGSVLTE